MTLFSYNFSLIQPLKPRFLSLEKWSRKLHNKWHTLLKLHWQGLRWVGVSPWIPPIKCTRPDTNTSYCGTSLAPTRWVQNFIRIRRRDREPALVTSRRLWGFQSAVFQRKSNRIWIMREQSGSYRALGKDKVRPIRGYQIVFFVALMTILRTFPLQFWIILIGGSQAGLTVSLHTNGKCASWYTFLAE